MALTMITSCGSVPYYAKHYSDIKWRNMEENIAVGKIATGGIYCTGTGRDGRNWWWKFYDDGSCIFFYADTVASDGQYIDFATTYKCATDLVANGQCNRPGIYKISGDTIHVNLYNAGNFIPGFFSANWRRDWYLARIKMLVKDKGHLFLMNDDEGHSTLDYNFVPCRNIMYPERLMELKDTKMMWSDRKEWKKWKKMKAD